MGNRARAVRDKPANRARVVVRRLLERAGIPLAANWMNKEAKPAEDAAVRPNRHKMAGTVPPEPSVGPVALVKNGCLRTCL